MERGDPDRRRTFSSLGSRWSCILENDQPRRTFLPDLEKVLGTAARIFAAKGRDAEVAMLTYSTPNLQAVIWDNWNGGTEGWELHLALSHQLYGQVFEEREKYCTSIKDVIDLFAEPYHNDFIERVRIVPALVDDPEWRQKANAWLSGNKSNQGRVRSDNVAPLSADGLLFRSNAEINFYRALKAKGISFAPLPVFIRGGTKYHRIEPDFVILYEGIVFVVEIDGDTVHQETPAEAHARLQIMQNEGCVVERIRAAACSSPDDASRAVEELLDSMKHVKLSR